MYIRVLRPCLAPATPRPSINRAPRNSYAAYGRYEYIYIYKYVVHIYIYIYIHNTYVCYMCYLSLSLYIYRHTYTLHKPQAKNLELRGFDSV